MSVAHVDELDAIEMPDGFVWRPVRRHFGIRAFGVNALHGARAPGGQIVEEHTEGSARPRGDLPRAARAGAVHGRRQRARARAGPARLRPRPAPEARRGRARRRHGRARARRQARRAAQGLGVGGDVRGRARVARGATGTRRSRSTRRRSRSSPTMPALLYNLACMEARGGRHLDALAAPAARGRARAEVGGARAQGLRLRRDPPRAGLSRPRAACYLGSPGSRAPSASARSAGTGSASGRATTQHRAEARPSASSASTSSVQADRERERLVRLLAAERHELLGPREAREHVAVGDGAHRDVGDDRPAVARRDRDRERVRAGERRPAGRRRQPPRRGGGQQRRRARRRRAGAPSSRASRSGTCACRRRRARAPAVTRAAPRRRRRASGSRARRRRPSAGSPARETTRRRARVERQLVPRLEPLDPREAVAAQAAALRVEEVRGERLDVRRRGSRAPPGADVRPQAARPQKRIVGQPRGRARSASAAGRG